MSKKHTLSKKGKECAAIHVPTDRLHVSFTDFKQLLAGNNAVLKLMDDMEDAGSDRELAAKGTVPLLSEIPVNVHLLDLGGGIRPGVTKATPADILSVPMAAILHGMTAMRWPGPPPVDAIGSIGMMAYTATLSEGQPLQMVEKSFAVVGASYMKFCIRLGYHFSLIEAWVGEQLDGNYIRFFFKGGGAILERRLRRAQLIGDILRVLDFQVKLVEDVIDAKLIEHRRADLESRLMTLGKLTAYTKQLDMAMFNNEVTDWYRNEFVQEHIPLPGGIR